MLILTRRPGERVVIGDEILVTVMGVSGHTVRLGIAAPEGVPIYREEIWLAVKEENRAAAAASADALPAEALAATGGDQETPAAQTPEGAAPGTPPEKPSGESPPGDQPRALPFAPLGRSGEHTTGRDMEQLLEREWNDKPGRR